MTALSTNCLQDVNYLKELCRKSPAIFAKTFLHNYASFPFAEFHYQVFDDLIAGHRRLVYATPREHGKSTIINLIYVLYCICYQKKKFILIVSDTATQAYYFLAAIKYELENNELIKGVFGDLYDEAYKWSERQFITSTGIMITSSGTGSNLRGMKHREARPDLIIGDDMENDEHVSTPMQREKTLNWVNKSFLNLGGIDTQIIIIGTILHYASLLSTLLKEENSDVWLQRKYATSIENPLWPEVWPSERLAERKREIGSQAFASEFQNEPAQADISPVKLEYIKRGEAPSLETLDQVIAIDPAISEKETADYFALTVAGKHKETGKIYIMQSYKTRCNITKQVNLVKNYHLKFPKAVVRIETVAYQKALAQLISDLKKSGTYIPVKEFKPDKDKSRRLQGVVPFIERGDVVFCYGSDIDDLITEMTQFPFAEHDDITDSAVSAIEFFIASKEPPSLVVF